MSAVAAQNMDENYAKFCEQMTLSGFNPELSHLMASGNEKSFYLMGATHRFGFMLTQRTNFFAPVHVSVTPTDDDKTSRETYVNPYDSYTRRNIPTERIEELRNRCDKLMNELRRNVLCMVDLPLFLDRHDAIFAAAQEIGDVTCLMTARSGSIPSVCWTIPAAT